MGEWCCLEPLQLPRGNAQHPVPLCPPDDAFINPHLAKIFERVRQSADFMPLKQMTVGGHCSRGVGAVSGLLGPHTALLKPLPLSRKLSTMTWGPTGETIWSTLRSDLLPLPPLARCTWPA